ncbi:hypothetical protein [Ochrobactrum sp. EDr1-4]|uniref:hypothetical protein n=1 Tax=Ochrobactrum sp. EDr1-4 TaxID=3368622 RepID=UPI003BA0BE53
MRATVDLGQTGTATYIVTPGNGQNVTVTQTDAAGIVSDATSSTLPDTLAPDALLGGIDEVVLFSRVHAIASQIANQNSFIQ